MKLRWKWPGLFMFAGAAAWAAVQPAATIDGGGARSANSLRRLNGTMGELAMISGRGPDMASSTRRIIPGFYGAAEGRRRLAAAADPAWLRLSDGGAAVAPRPVPERLHACNGPDSKALAHRADPDIETRAL